MARRAVIADVSAPDLYLRLLPQDAVPARLLADLTRFVWDTPVVKLDWALAEPIPWRAAGRHRRGNRAPRRRRQRPRPLVGRPGDRDTPAVAVPAASAR